MEESEKNLEVAETSAEVVEETTDVDETPQEEPTPEFTDTSEEQVAESTGESSTEESTQSAEENAKYASIRRRAEEEAQKKIQEAETKAYERGRLEAYKGKVNPYTNKPIKDNADIEVYETMYRLEQEGKDPINDLPDALSEKKRKEEKAARTAKEQNEKAKQEIEDFQTKYPDVNLQELLNDSFFNDYISGKNKALIDLYEGFNNFKNAFRNSAVNVAKQTIANSQSSPGSLSGNGDEPVIDFSTMSSEDFQKYVQRAKDGELRN
jgi:hypothetical protein